MNSPALVSSVSNWVRKSTHSIKKKSHEKFPWLFFLFNPVSYRVFTDELPDVEHWIMGLQPTGIP